jgi:hypothetical protein
LHGNPARLTDRRKGSAETYAHGIRWTAAARGAHDAGLVHQYALSFGAATIKAQNKTHMQSIREASDSV